MRRIIVTGADGFVGCHIVSAFLAAGHTVFAVDRQFQNPAYAQLKAERLHLVESDCREMPPISADALIHAAFITATPEMRGETPEANLRANIDPLLTVTAYAHNQEIGRSIFLSSVAVYDNTPATLLDEARPPQPLEVYGVAKTFLEQTVSSIRHRYGRDMIFARLGGIYGPYELPRASRPKLSLIGRMLHEALTRGAITVERPAERAEWTYAPDIGRALIALIQAESLNYTLYQLASGERLSRLDIARLIQQRIDDVDLRVISDTEATEAPTTRLGWLDTSRLQRDTGFNDWTKLSAETLESALRSLRPATAHA